jgi:hypothetical protein
MGMPYWPGIPAAMPAGWDRAARMMSTVVWLTLCLALSIPVFWAMSTAWFGQQASGDKVAHCMNIQREGENMNKKNKEYRETFEETLVAP